METAIRFENVSRKFILYQDRPRSFQEAALGLLKKRVNRREEFWALSDVSFAVQQGENVGIIGPNGSGKSTTLKLVSRIIEPTSGRVEVHGRISALLELGAGFHPDLTGRENVYLNGAILGFRQAQLKQKLDDIVAFAELERFIDVPVKHYSSGMYVRLGFAVAVHTDPELLLVDEVLAVGDAVFQRKCLDRINEMKSEGVTILFVSHSLAMVQDVCQRSIWLQDGHVADDGPTERILAGYLNTVSQEQNAALQQQQQEFETEANRWGSREVEITGVRFFDDAGVESAMFQTGAPMVVRIAFQAHQRIERPLFGAAIHRNDGIHINGPNTRFGNCEIEAVEGAGEIEYRIESLPLLKGTYEFSAAVHDYNGEWCYDHHHRMYCFMVETGDIAERYGCIYMPSQWRLV